MATTSLSRSSVRVGLLTAFLTLGVTSATLAQGAASLEVTPSGAAPAGSTVMVKWSGPNASGDYITVVRKGAPVFEYLGYQATSDGRSPVNPVSIVLPAEPGAYEIRYVFSGPRRVLAAVPYEVDDSHRRHRRTGERDTRRQVRALVDRPQQRRRLGHDRRARRRAARLWLVCRCSKRPS